VPPQDRNLLVDRERPALGGLCSNALDKLGYVACKHAPRHGLFERHPQRAQRLLHRRAARTRCQLLALVLLHMHRSQLGEPDLAERGHQVQAHCDLVLDLRRVRAIGHHQRVADPRFEVLLDGHAPGRHESLLALAELVVQLALRFRLARAGHLRTLAELVACKLADPASLTLVEEHRPAPGVAAVLPALALVSHGQATS
jgi:hypothetical protein